MPSNDNNAGRKDEAAIIEEIIGSLTSSSNVTIPPGDDCASVTLDGEGQELLLTSDPVLAGVHFDSTATPEQIGHKAAGRVLSDLAARRTTPVDTPKHSCTDIFTPRHHHPHRQGRPDSMQSIQRIRSRRRCYARRNAVRECFWLRYSTSTRSNPA